MKESIRCPACGKSAMSLRRRLYSPGPISSIQCQSCKSPLFLPYGALVLLVVILMGGIIAKENWIPQEYHFYFGLFIAFLLLEAVLWFPLSRKE